MKTTRTARRIVAAAAALCVSAGALVSSASAGVSQASIASDASTSKKHLASLSGTASYDEGAQTLTIVLKNTASRGFLTGFAFDAKGSAKALYLDGDNPATKVDEDPFDQLAGKKHKSLVCKPFGIYETGAGLDGKWKGGKIRRGVAAGATHTFVFNVTGADAGESVVDLLSRSGSSLVANFRGFKHGKSDAVGASLTLLPGAGDGTNTSVVTPSNDGSLTTPVIGGDSLPPVVLPGSTGDGGSPNAVPLPPAAWGGLGLMGLVAVMGLRRRSTIA